MSAVPLLCLLLSAPAPSPVPTAGDDRLAVQKVVKEAYVDGVHASFDAAAVRRGFHPDFRMLVLRDGQLASVTLEEWIGRLQQAAPEAGKSKRPRIRSQFPLVDVSGDAALVKVEIYRDGRQVFSDYLSLYRFPDGWKIVGKIFYAHPRAS